MTRSAFVLVALALLLAACAPTVAEVSAPTSEPATGTPVPTATLAPTITPSPTATFTPTPEGWFPLPQESYPDLIDGQEVVFSVESARYELLAPDGEVLQYFENDGWVTVVHGLTEQEAYAQVESLGFGEPLWVKPMGEEGSWSVHNINETAYPNLKVSENALEFNHPEGSRFFFGIIGEAWGFETYEDFMAAVEAGETVTFENGFWNQDGPVTIDLSKISFIFTERPAEHLTDTFWADTPEREILRAQDGWWERATRDHYNDPIAMIKFEVAEDGRLNAFLANDLTQGTPEEYAENPWWASSDLRDSLYDAMDWLGWLVRHDGQFDRDVGLEHGEQMNRASTEIGLNEELYQSTLSFEFGDEDEQH